MVGPILFLDIDGVLNGHEQDAHGYCRIQAGPVVHLNRILAETEARLVIASSWRYLVHSGAMTLEELRGRGQLVAPGLELPALSVRVTGQGWRVDSDCHALWLHAVAGMLHAMADDYGVLAVIEVRGSGILVDVPVVDFNEGRPFSISDPAVGAA